MEQKYTKEEVEHIRLLFTDGGRVGILQRIVNERLIEHPNIEVNPMVLKTFYQILDCSGVVSLIDGILFEKNSGNDLQDLGSNSIDFLQVTNGPFTLEAAMTMQSLHMGNPKTNTSPLQWLAYLMKGFSELTSEQMSAFDTVCNEFVLMGNARSFTDVNLF